MQRTYHLKIAYERKLVKPYRVEVVLEEQTQAEAWQAILSATPLTCLHLGEGRMVIRRKAVYHQAAEPEKVETSYTYAGVVKDSETGERIPYASVSVLGTPLGTVANQEGFFSLSQLSASQDSLKVSHLGYSSTICSLDKKAKGHQEVKLEPAYALLEEVEIKERPTIGLLAFTPKSGQHIINTTKTNQLPQIGERDVFRSLQFLPGVSIADETSASLSVRGSSPDQNLVLFDGFTIYHLDHLYGFFSSLNADAIKDIRIYKGGFGAKHGGRASSLIDISGKSGNQYRSGGSLGLNLLSANFSAETPWGEKGTAFIAFRRSYTDVFQSGLYQNLISYTEQETPSLLPGILNPIRERDESFYYYDANIKLSYRPSDDDKLSLSFYQGADDYEMSSTLAVNTNRIGFQEDIDEQFYIANTGVGLQWNRIWNKKLFSSLNLGYSNYASQYDMEMNVLQAESEEMLDRSFNTERENTLDEYTAKLDFEYTPTVEHQLDFGLFNTYNAILYQDQNSRQSIRLQNRGSQTGGYIQHIYRPLAGFSMTSGLRTTYYSLDNQLYLEPRLSFNFEIQENMYLKGSAGQYYQFLNKANSDLGKGFEQDFWVLSGNKSMPVLSAQQYMIGLSYTKNEWMLDAEVYLKNMQGLALGNYESFVETNATRPYWSFNKIIADGSAKVKGIDLMLSRSWEHNTTTVSYSLASNRQQFDEINEGAAFFADEDQRHEFKWASQWDFHPWTFSLNWIYGSGQPYSAPTEISSENGLTKLVYSEKNNNRLPAYHRMDASASYQFNIGRNKAELGVSLFNLYNQQNIGDRSFLFDRFGFYQSERNRQLVQLISVDQLLLNRTLSVFLNFRF
ncbi:TonB-dependent receptor [Porifericola rhodea]|uniref:TonB-dependent receptor n=1 Tax=Porifericola rhodea TaxID=930972 RepID=UPI002667045F|nr:TonB-dependent receptor [Porifericola rhodea]WKN33880.1 TonB-dependent receptor [Porifericola rhodea]